MNDTAPKVLFGFALLLGVFLYGIATREFQLFPYPQIATAIETFQDLRTNWKNDLQIEPTRHLKPAQHPGSGVTANDGERLQPGLTFMAGLFDGEIAARLIRADGSVVHEWPVSFSEIWPDRQAKHKDEPLTDWNVFLHGILALPDGSIVFNFDEGQSLVKMGRCGEIVWKLDEPIHHSVFQADDGTFWVPVGHAVGQVSADGELLQRISIVRMIRDAGLHGVLYIHEPRTTKMHPNDVEVLSEDLAPAFPQFEAGDVMYSMRDLNLVIVFDPETQTLKWFQHGPWLRQHDPDFLPDGRISVFNNRMQYEASDIMVVDPQTRDLEIVYAGTEDAPFYTALRGKHQTLANGNILITSSHSGRAFEVTPGRDIVWEFINRYDDKRVGVLSNAIRYPNDYFRVDDWGACGG